LTRSVLNKLWRPAMRSNQSRPRRKKKERRLHQEGLTIRKQPTSLGTGGQPDAISNVEREQFHARAEFLSKVSSNRNLIVSATMQHESTKQTKPPNEG
jgi:hypothetical protein